MSRLGEFREPRPPLWLEQQRVYHGISYAYPNPYLEDDDLIPPSILRSENGPSTFGALDQGPIGSSGSHPGHSSAPDRASDARGLDGAPLRTVEPHASEDTP